jgi:beta-mannosidase
LQDSDDEGTCFTFAVNGLRVFCKGANWVPADSFPSRVTKERYSKLLDMAAEANVNMIRVWGGGIYEDDAFYDLCDRLGIMVWQDFMYACAAYPEDDWFLREAEREAEEVVRRLRGHACIVVWCGNNESHWQHHTVWKDRDQLLGLPIFNKVLPKVCQKLDPTRPYRPSSPYGGEDPNSECEGTRHNWTVWSKQNDYPAYLEDKGRFLIEFGWQAPPTLNLLVE